MAAYILRRLMLIVPTLIGILLVNFVLVQFMPGGPVEQVIARLESDSSATGRISGGGIHCTPFFCARCFLLRCCIRDGFTARAYRCYNAC